MRQQNIPAEDLSDLSGPAPRGAGLGDLLSGTPAPARREPLPQTGGGAVEQVLESPAPTRPKAASRPPRQASVRTRSKPTSAVYVSQGVKLRFEDYRHKAKKTNLQVVLEAITAKHGQLADIIKASAVSTAPVGGSLFPSDPSAVRYLGGGAVQIGFSPTPEQENVLDALGEELGFSTRSTWIAPILNAFLPGRKDS
nr:MULTISPECIES: hypothetical protein [unclassified Mycolicibacterium]